jgi:hypothetical protein
MAISRPIHILSCLLRLHYCPIPPEVNAFAGQLARIVPGVGDFRNCCALRGVAEWDNAVLCQEAQNINDD